jgi:hypothetical protein
MTLAVTNVAHFLRYLEAIIVFIFYCLLVVQQNNSYPFENVKRVLTLKADEYVSG